MLNFQRLSIDDKARYEELLFAGPERGCEYSFANLYLWGRQLGAFQEEGLSLFSHFNGKTVYPYPLGSGDKTGQISRLMEDARQRGIPFRMTGLSREEAENLEAAFPGVFYIHQDRDGSDYVYDIQDLADLKGRKYQKKRNHVNKFRGEHPNWRVEPITPCNMARVQHMVNDWFLERKRSEPSGDYLLESLAMAKALRHLKELDMESLVLLDGDEVLAVTMASRLSADTFDVHFEKAKEGVEGAYTVINQAFAGYLRDKYPQVKFLNREEDMGLEGLRRAKLSYYPHHMTEKFWVRCRRDLNEDM